MCRNTVIFALLSIACLILLLLDICSGSVFVFPWQLHDNEIVARLLWNLRVPKALTAILAGAALSVSGLMMQTLFRNPLAGPYILGVSSGAGLGVAIATMCGTMLAVQVVSFSIVAAAIIGSTLVLLLVLAIAKKVSSNVSLLIVGMMLGSIAGALVNLIQNFSNPDALKLFVVWTLGSLDNVGWTELRILFPVLAIGGVLCLFLLKPLNGLLLGENYAQGLGVNVNRTRLMIVLATGLLAGGVTAWCGPIAFIGVAVPHIARGILRTSNHRLTMPMAALIGANILLCCDVLASLFTYPLPISTMSALFGAPIIIWIIVRGKS
ncbi:MAG: iron ABC transporter permease [Paludibacteraceae bacterium]|nr:iron ABC transporter permease [Paludibacteraceae bacterium]